MTSTRPLILGFDTSGGACNVALTRGADVLVEVSEIMSKGQAERLMTLCTEVLLEAGETPTALGAIGVGVGPGNFTGIRISVAAARGLALGLGVPAVGVNAFDSLRYGHPGPCVCVVDARRGEVYTQSFDENGLSTPPEIVPSAKLTEKGAPLIGSGYRPPAVPTAVAICHLAGQRFHESQPRPAPLYLRPADAAPARDAPPTLLT